MPLDPALRRLARGPHEIANYALNVDKEAPMARKAGTNEMTFYYP